MDERSEFHQRPRTPPPWQGVLESANTSKSARILYDTLGVYQVACDYEELYRAAQSEEECEDLCHSYKRLIKWVMAQKVTAKVAEAIAYDLPVVLLWVIYIWKGK
jgi:hypothetical protein